MESLDDLDQFLEELYPYRFKPKDITRIREYVKPHWPDN